jgi:hypothetical protein
VSFLYGSSNWINSYSFYATTFWFWIPSVTIVCFDLALFHPVYWHFGCPVLGVLEEVPEFSLVSLNSRYFRYLIRNYDFVYWHLIDRCNRGCEECGYFMRYFLSLNLEPGSSEHTSWNCCQFIIFSKPCEDSRAVNWSNVLKHAGKWSELAMLFTTIGRGEANKFVYQYK